MKKSDLKIGYLLECRNGILKMLMPSEDTLVLMGQDGCYYEIDALKDDLTTNFDKDFDIVKVYGLSKYHSRVLDFDKCDRKLLWTNQKKEMTVEQIEKELGYSIKIIKG